MQGSDLSGVRKREKLARRGKMKKKKKNFKRGKIAVRLSGEF